MRTRRSLSSSDPVVRNTTHRSVLLHEAITVLAISPDDIVVDATLGGAGHAHEMAKLLGARGTFIGFDLDADAIARAKEALGGARARVHLIQANFRDMQKELEALGVRHIAKALFDLGWSSYQLDSGRGFSIHADEPLLMTYPKGGAAVTAAVVVNTWAEESIADILYGFGGERYSRRIAKAIVERREKRPFTTAKELAEVIAEAVPPAYRHGRIHPATRSFQALRVAVNDELGALSQGIRSAVSLLEEGGRIAVITFHSVEDRAVKTLFMELERKGEGRRLTKKPLSPSEEEIRKNPRARSAKLRVFEKTSYDKKTFEDKQI